LKGYLEGLDIRALGERYLETCSDDEFDLRVIKSTLTWIRAGLKLVAKRFGKASYARAIMLNPEQLKAVKSNVPSLEEFREERDPYEMYSEEDLIELFRKHIQIREMIKSTTATRDSEKGRRMHCHGCKRWPFRSYAQR
jgi:hypothetical protein